MVGVVLRLAAVVALVGCGGRATAIAETDSPAALACDGAIGTKTVVLRSDLTGGKLLTHPELLIVVESTGRVLEIDRCSGESVELTSGLGGVSSAVLLNDDVWVLSAADEGSKRLTRVPLNGASGDGLDVDAVASELVTDGSALFFLRRTGQSTDVFMLSVGSAAPTRVASLPDGGGLGLRLLDASAAGLYFSQDCDCAPVLRLLAPQAEALTAFEGVGGVGVWGSYAVEISGDTLFVALNEWSGGGRIQRLPLGGGASEPVLTEGAGWSTGLAARADALCWLSGRSDAERSIRCGSLSSSTANVHEIERIDSSQPVSLGLWPDALYWLRPASNGLYELAARAL